MDTNITITLEITLNGETRTVEFMQGRDDLASSLPVFAARIGNGVKSHRVCGLAWKRNGEWAFSTATYVLNREARITQWADTVGHTKSNHVGSKI